VNVEVVRIWTEPIPGQLTVDDALAETAEASQADRCREETDDSSSSA